MILSSGRFFKTLKREDAHLQEYWTFAEAAASLGRFIETVYNRSGCAPVWPLCHRPSLKPLALYPVMR
jgi:hypothetical protein